jgi:hypothetical protein
MRRLSRLVSLTIGASAAWVSVAFGQQPCTDDDVASLRDKHVVMLRKNEVADEDDEYVNGVLVSSDGLILTVTSLLYKFDPNSAPQTEIWKQFRSLKTPLLDISASSNRTTRTFEAAGRIVGFDAWRDLLLVKVPQVSLKGMEPVSLSDDTSIEGGDLCYASYIDSDKGSGGPLKLSDTNDDMGYWQNLDKSDPNVQSEERGAGVFARNNSGGWSLHGILSDAHFDDEEPLGVLTVLYADTLLAHLMYSPMQEICRIRLEQLRWDYTIERSESLGKLGNESELAIRIHHNDLREGTQIKRVRVKWKIHGRKAARQEDISTDDSDTDDDKYVAVELAQNEKPLSSDDLVHRSNKIDFQDELSLARDQNFESIQRITLHMFSTLEVPGCRDKESYDAITVYLPTD